MNNSIALIFPAFVSDYHGDEISSISQYNQHFDQYLIKASNESGINLTSFDIQNNKFLNDELKSQLMAYVFSCCVSDIIKEKKIKANFVAGYSMGIYAALHHAGVFSFETGINLIRKAYDIIFQSKGETEYGMATIAGIDDDDLINIIKHEHSDAEIINANSRHSFVISGKYHEIERIVQASTNEGALLARILPVTVPYHSRHMKEGAKEFAIYVETQKFNDSDIPLVSLIDQRLITTAKDTKHELVLNISNKINWYKTQLKMAGTNTCIMLECGAGRSLYKMSKFIDKDIKVYPLNKISDFIEKAGLK